MSKQVRVESRELRKVKAAIVEQRGRRRRWAASAGSVIILALLVAIAVTLVKASGKEDSPPVASGPVVAPAGATSGGALAVGKPTAPVKLEVYLDYMCPFCGRFERTNGHEIDRLVAAGTLRLELYPLAFLDRMSAGSRYSTRAANAAATVADRAPDKLLVFNQALFDRQPQEGSRGLSDDQIAELARAAGVLQRVVDVFDDRIFGSWLAASTDTAFKTGISGTPTVKINGQVFTGDLYTVGPLTRAISAAKGNG